MKVKALKADLFEQCVQVRGLEIKALPHHWLVGQANGHWLHYTQQESRKVQTENVLMQYA